MKNPLHSNLHYPHQLLEKDLWTHHSLLEPNSVSLLPNHTGEGEVIDCVDIYKQPAFSHPLLVNHTLQLEPSFDTNRRGSQDGEVAIQQSWHKYGKCPQGSIPILRQHGTGPQFRKASPFSRKNNDEAQFDHAWALVNFKRKAGIQGARGAINVWRPFVNLESGSMSQIWMGAGRDRDLNSIEFGWRVVPTTGSSEPTLFIYWTRDNYESTGCYNLECPGFVQTGQLVTLGGKLYPISTYAGQQYEIDVSVRMDNATQNWWLTIHSTPIGYWPSTLFSSMLKYADIIGWGGEVVEKSDGKYERSTQMGSGFLPKESLTKSSFVHVINYDDANNVQLVPKKKDLEILVTSDDVCFDLNMEWRNGENVVFYGGPGCK